MPGKGIKSRVGEYFTGHANVDVTLTEVTKELDISRQQFLQSVSDLNRNGFQILSVVPGGVYRHPSGKGEESAPRDRIALYEILAITKDGSLILKDEADEIWQARKLS